MLSGVPVSFIVNTGAETEMGQAQLNIWMMVATACFFCCCFSDLSSLCVWAFYDLYYWLDFCFLFCWQLTAPTTNVACYDFFDGHSLEFISGLPGHWIQFMKHRILKQYLFKKVLKLHFCAFIYKTVPLAEADLLISESKLTLGHPLLSSLLTTYPIF